MNKDKLLEQINKTMAGRSFHCIVFSYKEDGTVLPFSPFATEFCQHKHPTLEEAQVCSKLIKESWEGAQGRNPIIKCLLVEHEKQLGQPVHNGVFILQQQVLPAEISW